MYTLYIYIYIPRSPIPCSKCIPPVTSQLRFSLAPQELAALWLASHGLGAGGGGRGARRREHFPFQPWECWPATLQQLKHLKLNGWKMKISLLGKETRKIDRYLCKGLRKRKLPAFKRLAWTWDPKQKKNRNFQTYCREDSGRKNRFANQSLTPKKKTPDTSTIYFFWGFRFSLHFLGLLAWIVDPLPDTSRMLKEPEIPANFRNVCSIRVLVDSQNQFARLGMQWKVIWKLP